MDFMKWLNSLDELLFEVMSWLIFFPLTLWRALAQPMSMMAYADEQLALPDEEQYSAAVSPPLFLALSLLLAHGVAAALGQTDEIIASQHGLAALVDDQTSALVLRLVLFAIFPLLMSLQLLRRRGVPIGRGTLRLPFYGQCYPAAVFALTLSLGTTITSLTVRAADVAGISLVVLSHLYFFGVEMRWFMMQLSIGPARAASVTLLALVQGYAVFLLVGFFFTR